MRDRERNLAKGTACTSCRQLKIRCSGSKPICSWCQRHRKQCVYAAITPSKAQGEYAILQARVLDLEIAINKHALSSQHDLLVISARLQERVKHLGRWRDQPAPWSATVQAVVCCEGVKTDTLASWELLGSIEPQVSPREGETVSIHRTVVEYTLASFQWTKGEELPIPMSLYLVGLFLPHRSHFQFFFPLSRFLARLSLPSTHPDSVHPCLRNACHLAACSILGGHWSSLETYFIQRTRYFLGQIIMLVDFQHFTQYLWASSLLASYFVKARRLEEAFVIIAAASQLAKGYGLLSICPLDRDDSYDGVLPTELRTHDESLDLLWLLQSLFMVDQSLSTLAAFPLSFIRGKYLIPFFDRSDIAYPSFKVLRFRALLVFWWLM
ncbi:hypothetical protein DL93DRAFT_1746854 [Clavulina sp. PMI_390]|nr:hypothetical protein DL93DRAFT_1746854 [Clavulina sp. PMI_390]